MEIKVVQDTQDENGIVISGGRIDNPTMDMYLEDVSEEWKQRMLLLADFIKNSEYYKITADKFCNDNHFRFSDGREIAFTWRGWGDFMQAIVGEREGYMAYYM